MSELSAISSENAVAEHGIPSDSKTVAVATPSRSVCGCGAEQHPDNPERCAKGHQWKGTPSIARREQLSTLLVDQVPITVNASSCEIAVWRRDCALRQVRMQEARLAQPLTEAKRRAEQRVLDAFLRTLQQAQEEVERLTPAAPNSSDPYGIAGARERLAEKLRAIAARTPPSFSDLGCATDEERAIAEDLTRRWTQRWLEVRKNRAALPAPLTAGQEDP